MRSRRAGFALIMVLVSVAALLALAMHASIAARGHLNESRAWRDRVLMHRHAHTAAVLVITGLIPADLRDVADDPAGAGGAQRAAGGAADEAPQGLEIPAFLKALLPELEDLEDDAADAAAERRAAAAGMLASGGLAGRDPGKAVLAGIAAFGFPKEPLEVPVAGGRYRVDLRDAAGLLDINTADERALRAYLAAKGFPPVAAGAVADQILDWRDEDRIPRPSGLEQDSYDRLGIVARNGRFAALEELLYLPAVSPEVFAFIRRDLTLHAGDAVSAASAPLAVLAAVPGLDERLAAEIIAARTAAPLTAERLERLLPPTRRDALDSLSVRPSPFISLRVEALAQPSGRVVAAFQGMAIVGPAGVDHLALTPIVR